MTLNMCLSLFKVVQGQDNNKEYDLKCFKIMYMRHNLMRKHS